MEDSHMRVHVNIAQYAVYTSYKASLPIHMHIVNV